MHYTTAILKKNCNIQSNFLGISIGITGPCFQYYTQMFITNYNTFHISQYPSGARVGALYQNSTFSEKTLVPDASKH